MPENILVVEYEPRYTDRVRHALAGQPLEPSFAHDGEEALRAFDSQRPKLIVLSSVVPKGNTSDLIHAIRQREHLQQIPILLTVSGYTGTSTKQDALRLGATDILPKPFSEGDFLSKVHQMLGRAAGQLTSDQIFGDLLEEPVAKPEPKKAMSSKSDVDKLVADTLSGLRSQTSAPKPKTMPGTSSIDKRLADLASSTRPKTAAGTTPVPRVAAVQEEKVHFSEPFFPRTTPAPPPAEAEEEEPTDGVKFGQYVLLEKIASGGMAEVWKARMRGVEGFQKIVAIKKILPHLSDNQDFIEMFIDEAKLAAQLNHNNIIHIYDLGKIQNSYYIAMEYIDGYDLKTILKRAEERDQPLAVELALFMASKIAAALDYAHRKRDFENRDLGLVHRDVSPQNVLISQEGDIKLCDFGIAKAASKASQTHAGALKGKLQYMSPEQAWGRAIDKRSDIFALATVLFEMLTRRKLFGGENEMSILEQVREARVEPPSKYNEEVTSEVDRIVLKALEKDPANRYQSAADMARDIDSVLYEFKPTPTSADLAIYMHRLNAAPAVVPMPVAEPEPEPPTVPEARPVEVVTPPAPRGVVMPAWNAPPEQKKRTPVVPLAVAATVVIVATGGFLLMRARSSSPAQSIAAPVRTTPVSTPTETIASVAQPTVPQSVATTTIVPAAETTPILDPAKVEEEVRKRLAAERAKLEQARAQQPAPQPPSVPVTLRPAPQPVPPSVVPQPVTQTVAPQIVENRPPAPVPMPQPVTQSLPPPPAPTPQPVVETPRTKEGDLVTSGSEDVPAKMLRRAAVPYPPLAKLQRVQGTVLVNALISEAGLVLQTRVIRPINRPVGLNEAAEMIVRRSTFSAPIKDGVRVKAWTTVPVDFKL